MLPGIPGECPHQWGTYRFPAASNAALLACPSEMKLRTWRNDPSGLRHCTLPSSRATKTSPLANAPFETVTVTEVAVAVLLAASRATAVRVWAPSAAAAVLQLIEYGAVVASAPR